MMGVYVLLRKPHREAASSAVLKKRLGRMGLRDTERRESDSDEPEREKDSKGQKAKKAEGLDDIKQESMKRLGMHSQYWLADSINIVALVS
jgi:hypothetical protein